MNAAFETWRPPPGAAFAAVVAATSWHWADPELRYRRAWELLRPEGHLAFWAAVHVLPVTGDPIFLELLDVYEEIGAGRAASWPRPRELPDARNEILASGLFDRVTVTQFDWEVPYDAEGYVELLETFSANIAMPPWQRERLYAEVRRRWPSAPTGCSAATGAPRCTWPGGSTTPRPGDCPQRVARVRTSSASSRGAGAWAATPSRRPRFRATA